MKFRLIIDKTKDEEVVATVHSPSDLTEKLQQLVLEHTGSSWIAAFTEEEARCLPFSQIACITVLEGKTYAIDCKGIQYRLKQRLYEIEAVLPPSFIRINKSAIANEAHLERFCAAFNGAVDAVFRGGWREYVSRRCFAQIKRRYGL